MLALPLALLLLAAPATAAAPTIALPAGQNPTQWQEALALAGLTRTAGSADVVVRSAGSQWVIEIHGPGGVLRALAVPAPTDEAGREDLVVLAASLLEEARVTLPEAPEPEPHAPAVADAGEALTSPSPPPVSPTAPAPTPPPDRLAALVAAAVADVEAEPEPAPPSAPAPLPKGEGSRQGEPPSPEPESEPPSPEPPSPEPPSPEPPSPEPEPPSPEPEPPSPEPEPPEPDPGDEVTPTPPPPPRPTAWLTATSTLSWRPDCTLAPSLAIGGGLTLPRGLELGLHGGWVRHDLVGYPGERSLEDRGLSVSLGRAWGERMVQPAITLLGGPSWRSYRGSDGLVASELIPVLGAHPAVRFRVGGLDVRIGPRVDRDLVETWICEASLNACGYLSPWRVQLALTIGPAWPLRAQTTAPLEKE